jgi:hypothetical protein
MWEKPQWFLSFGSVSWTKYTDEDFSSLSLVLLLSILVPKNIFFCKPAI